MKKILIVDDSQTIRTMCELIHKGTEDKVLTAATIAEAEKVIAAESPDVIFVDYTLPDGNVYDFIRAHAGEKSGIVMLGGTFSACDAEQALAAGALDVVIKPFRTEAFFAAEDKAYAKSQGGAVSQGLETSQVPEASATSTLTKSPSTLSSPGIPSAPIPRVGGSVPLSQQGRFNMPGSQSGTASSPSNRAVSASSPSNPSIDRSYTAVSGLLMAPSEQAATPTNPNPPVSEPSIPQAAVADNSALIRAEVVAVLKVMLPPMINSYVKKLIQAEVRPQLQNWVDTRVETVVRSILDQNH